MLQFSPSSHDRFGKLHFISTSRADRLARAWPDRRRILAKTLLNKMTLIVTSEVPRTV